MEQWYDEVAPVGRMSSRHNLQGAGRKSRRLLSRFQKEVEAKKAAAEAQQAQSQTQAALAGLTSDGRVADYLLQTCSQTELQDFASQVMYLLKSLACGTCVIC